MDKYYEQANLVFELVKNVSYRKTKDRHGVFYSGVHSWLDVKNALLKYNKVAVYRCGTLYETNFDICEPCVETNESENDSIYEEYRYLGFNEKKLQKGTAIKLKRKDEYEYVNYLVGFIEGSTVKLFNRQGRMKILKAQEIHDDYDLEILK